jgi:hypothetical protein
MIVGEAVDQTCDVAVVGAGPYGLAAAARLRALGDIDVSIFGEPMSFWDGMPKGMLLRSHWDACHIGFPNGDLTLDGYQAASGSEFGKPVPLDAFVAYGRWFQETAVPDVDTRRVSNVASRPGGFRLLLEDGETVGAGRVVVAAGIEEFANRPVVFDGFPTELVTHASDHRDLSCFAGQRVLVLGGGQSALESAALLHESGAEVEVIALEQQLIWLHGGTVQRRLGRFKPLLYAQTDVGPAGLSRLVAAPGFFRRLPRGMQTKMAYRAVRPAGARWLVDRLEQVPLSTGRMVVDAHADTDGVLATLDDGAKRRADHVILGTGYRVDIGNYGFLEPDLVSAITQVNGYPLLAKGLESSVPGLHFLGAPAAWSFGPIMRFVSGSWFASERLAKQLETAVRVA